MRGIPSRERLNFTLRLGESERRVLEAAAWQRREHLGEFIRRVSVEVARGELLARSPAHVEGPQP